MSAAQRKALLGMMDAILAVKHCPADIRARAESLEAKLDPVAGFFRGLGFPVR